MLFPTIEFLLFFFVVFFASWGLKDHLFGRKLLLLLASYVFYGFWDVRFVGLLFGVSLLNYLIGLLLERLQSRRLILTIGVIANLTVLGFFKYWGFFATNLVNALSYLGLEREIPIWDILLPMGVSFFVFQGISYIIDIYRGEIKAQRNLVDLLLYISFFPQLVAGPIVRAKDFLPQLERTADAENIPMANAFILIAVGLFKKVIVAHYLGVKIVDPVFSAPQAFHALDVLWGAYAYALQIYCDFSAYSDMAIGIAALLGFHFQPNFAQPYRAASISAFWRRWHISLSSWLRDYLYIPLGGNRHGSQKTYRNLLVTMVLGGLWHGAAITFMLWGFLHGVALIGERIWSAHATAKNWNLPKTLGLVLTFHFVCFCWIFFRSPTIDHAINYLYAFANFEGSLQLYSSFSIILMTICFGSQFLPEDIVPKIERLMRPLPVSMQGAMLGISIVIIGAMGPGTLAPFIYFQF